MGSRFWADLCVRFVIGSLRFALSKRAISLVWELKICFSGQGRAGEAAEGRSKTGRETKIWPLGNLDHSAGAGFGRAAALF